MNKTHTATNRQRLDEAHEAARSGSAALATLCIAGFFQSRDQLENAHSELAEAAKGIDATLPAVVELLQLGRPTSADPIVVQGEKYATAHQAIAELVRRAVVRIEALKTVLAENPDDADNVLAANLDNLRQDYDVDLQAEQEIEHAQALKIADQWMPSDQQGEAAGAQGGPTQAELDALRAWQQAIEESPGLDDNASLWDCWRYITTEGVEVRGEAYRPVSFEAWARARRRAQEKIGRGPADSADS
jgi:hypothetical protein